MPCMNLMSAAVYCTFERSVAFCAVMTWLAWPGAPGWTIGGGWSARGGAAAGAALLWEAVLQDAPMQEHISATIRPDLKVKAP